MGASQRDHRIAAALRTHVAAEIKGQRPHDDVAASWRQTERRKVAKRERAQRAAAGKGRAR